MRSTDLAFLVVLILCVQDVPDPGPAAEGNPGPAVDWEMAQATPSHLADEAEHGGATRARGSE